MYLTDVLSAIDAIKKGTFVRIVYDSELPQTALARKMGVVIKKRTEKVVRMGVKYSNIAEVIKQESQRVEPKREYTPWSHWIIEDLISKHNTKDDYYLTFATVKNGSHTRCTYFCDGKEMTYEQVAQSPFVLPSYFKPSAMPTLIQKVKIANVIEIGGSRA